MRSRDQFKIKKAVSNDLVVVKDKSKITSKVHWYFYLVNRTFFTSFYFYFFPLLSAFVPLFFMMFKDWDNFDTNMC